MTLTFGTARQRGKKHIGCPLPYTLQHGFFSSVGKFIGVARIFSGGALFPQKADDLFLAVALKTQAKTTKWTTPTLQISPAQQNRVLTKNCENNA